VTNSVDQKIHLLVDDPRSPYETLSDFAEAAFRNHLELECSDRDMSEVRDVARAMSESVSHEARRPSDPSSSPAGSAVDEGAPLPELMAPISDVPEVAVGTVEPSDDPSSMGHLSFLVNRLNPLPVVCRSLARTAPQEFEGLQGVVGEPARVVGFRLKADDVINKRAMVDRLATSWPVGDDADKSINKFLMAYVGDSAHPGALVQLSLAFWDGLDQLRLTSLGAELAKCTSPIVDIAADKYGRVSGEAIEILKRAIASNQTELELVRVFLDAVAHHLGHQSQVDDELAHRMKWSLDVAATTRAALIGRLRDLNVVEVNGRGAKAAISIVESEPFEGISTIVRTEGSR
jgi:hypothetical protein